MLCFFDKKKKNHLEISLFYTCVPKILIICLQFLRYRVWQCDRLKVAIRGHFLPAPPPPPKKKKRSPWKIRIRYFTYFHQKTQSYVVWFLRYSVRQIEFLSFWAIFCPFTTLTPEKSKFFEKNAWRYQHFTLVYPKWQSYDVWFLKYGVQQTQFFVILVYFLPF